MATLEYIFYQTDCSFDYDSPFGTATYYDYENHGFELEIDSNDNINMSSFQAFGDYEEMNHKCKTLDDLKNYILEHYQEIQDYDDLDDYCARSERFDELLDIINDNLKKAA
jgi:hypothetical protein